MNAPDPFELLRDRAPSLSPRVLENVQKGMGAHKVQSLSRGMRLVLSGLASLLVLGLLSAPRVAAGQYSLLTLGALLALGAVLTLLVPALPGVRAQDKRLGLVGRRVLLTVALLAVFAFFVFFAEAFAVQIEAVPWLRAVGKCATHGLLRGVLGLALLLAIWRHTDPFTPRLSAGLLGVVSGLLGVFATTMACPNHEGWHLMVGHALIVSLTTSLGVALGKKYLAP